MLSRAVPDAGRRLAQLLTRVSEIRLRPVPTIPALVLLILSAIAIFAPVLAPYDPTQAALRDSLLPPAWLQDGLPSHTLGTDLFGRDQLSRLIFGARISLGVAALAICIGGGLGTLLGIAAGYLGGWVDAAIMRAADIVMSFPLILMAIVLAIVFGPSFLNIVLVISALIWPRIARQIRGETLALGQQDFVTYAIAAGVPAWKIMLRHIFPNVVPTLLVVTTLEVGNVILLEASLSFLGAGIPPPEPSWGLMVSDGRGQITFGWWIAMFPGFAIFLTVLSFNLLGDWLRDHLDPRLREL